jgi:hypothetical protein
LRTRLNVEEKLVNAAETFHDEIPVEEPAAENILEQVTEYFGDRQPETVEVANAK